MSLRRVRKRDGREVPFDASKIRDAIAKAMAAVGEDDEAFASEVAGVVQLTLESSSGTGAGGVPSIEDIQDLVERALIELGRARVAKAYILYRDRRARIRDALQVHRSERSVDGASLTSVRVRESSGHARWSKGRIVAALMQEAELPRATAEEVAARVEKRVFDGGLRRLSTGLIRELVDNELIAMGLDRARRRQGLVVLATHDLRAVIERTPPRLDSGRAARGDELIELAPEARVSAEIVRRFVLDSVLHEADAEAHLSGDFWIEDLDRAHDYLWTSLSADAFANPEAGAPHAFASLEALARVLQQTSRGLCVDAPSTLLQPLVEGGERGRLETWMASATAIARAAGRRLDLNLSHGPRSSVQRVWFDRCLRALDALEPSPFAPRVFADEQLLAEWLDESRDDDGACAMLERALLGGRVVPTWSARGERFAGPGCRRSPREQAAVSCGAAIGLNLPRLALLAGPWREDRVLEGLGRLLDRALDALERIAAFQRGAATSGEPWRGRVVYALSPVGLRECLQLVGDGEIRPEQGARIVGFLAEAAQRLGAERHLSVSVSPFFGGRARARFAELDRDLPQQSQRLLFEEGVGAGLQPGEPYSSGYRLSPVPGFVPWAGEAQMLSTVTAGALVPLPEERSRGGPVSIAEACSRFGRLRRDPPMDELSLDNSTLTPTPVDTSAGLFGLDRAPVLDKGLDDGREEAELPPAARTTD